MAISCQFLLLSMAVRILFAFAADNLLVSIDCGTSSGYTDSYGITWAVDAPDYILTGETATVRNINSSFHRSLSTLRYFTSRKKNCYVVPGATTGQKYLVRASFYYGNYDGKSVPPSFALQFDGNEWENVMTYTEKETVYEVIYAVKGKNISVCVAQTSPSQIPFISSLEVRALGSDMYQTDSTEDVLFNFVRIAYGSAFTVIRYPADPYDRFWYQNPPIPGLQSVTSDSSVVDTNVDNQPPKEAVLQAITPTSNTAKSLTIPNPVPRETDIDTYYYFYYSEMIDSSTANKSRAFYFTVNGTRVTDFDIVPRYQHVDTTYNRNRKLSSHTVLSWVNEPNATLPPLVNAAEFFLIIRGLSSGTSTVDLEGLKVLQDRYQQLQSWGGDPCLPVGYYWEWIHCSDENPPRVNALHLNGSGLTGSLPCFIAMDALEIIDLSNNSLSGNIPDFLGQFPRLKELNLAFNQFTGTLPESLRSNTNIKLNTTGNALGGPTSPDQKKMAVIVGASVGSFVGLLLLLVLFFLWHHKKPPVAAVTNDNRDIMQSREQQLGHLQAGLCRSFMFAEIIEITDHFRKVIGKGGSGNVYYGQLEDATEVAVKVLKDFSHGTQEFISEVKLLMKVHHKNLVSFIGFCEEPRNMSVLYEFMCNGNLRELISGRTARLELLTWKKRLEIALDVASGLQYLHSGCSPPIIHRDVKSSNILLNVKLEAKLTDFGLSRVGTGLDMTAHVTTAVVGTPGYIDPEYSMTCMLTKKSDIYSYGIVLLEIICGRPAIFGGTDHERHIAAWATSRIMRNYIDSIIDPRIQRQFQIESARKVVGLAIACTADKSVERPDIDDVVKQLTEALEMEAGNQSYETSPTG